MTRDPALSLDRRASVTYRHERWRAFSNGILETAAITFLLLIAVKWHHAGATAKALIAGGGSLGFLCSPLIVSTVATMGWPAARAASGLAVLGAASFLTMAAAPVLPVYVAGSMLATTASSAAIPLLTQIYQENYPPKLRGHLFSRTVMIRIGTAALFSEFAGRALSGHLERYRLLLLVFAAAFGLAAWALSRYPSRPLKSAGGRHPFRSMRSFRRDPLFRRTLICWMLMGFANLMMLPLRVEYLAHPDYGWEMTVGEVAFVTGVVPNVGRLLVSPLWGWLFDRMNFFILRVILNAGFALAILLFFFSDGLTGLILGALVFGISNGGGEIAWSLWVTKFAPPDEVADYMSVHTFFTGVRGLLAPMIGFHLVGLFSLQHVGWLAVGLIGIASAGMIPEIKYDRAHREGQALIEEVRD